MTMEWAANLSPSDVVAGAFVLVMGGIAISSRIDRTVERVERAPERTQQTARATTARTAGAAGSEARIDEPGREPLPAARRPRAVAESELVKIEPGARDQLAGQLVTGAGADGLQLTTTFERDGEALVLRYRVANRGTTSVYLLTPLQRYDFTAQRWEEDPARVYGRRLRGRGVELSKRVLPEKKGSFSYTHEVPHLTRLDPGKAFVETIRLPLPLTLQGLRSKKRREAVGQRVRFSIGYLRHRPVTLRPSRDGELTVGYAEALEQQRVLSSGEVELEVPVK